MWIGSGLTIWRGFHFGDGFERWYYFLFCYKYLASVVFALFSFFLTLGSGLSRGLVFYFDLLHLLFYLVEFLDKLEVIDGSFSGLVWVLRVLEQFTWIFCSFYWRRPRNQPKYVPLLRWKLRLLLIPSNSRAFLFFLTIFLYNLLLSLIFIRLDNKILLLSLGNALNIFGKILNKHHSFYNLVVLHMEKDL